MPVPVRRYKSDAEEQERNGKRIQRGLDIMLSVQLNNDLPRVYSNAGQHAEQVARYTLTGQIVKADNRPFTAGGDCGNLQIKSARATICKGTDFVEHINKDPATAYGYVTADFSTMYILTKAEYKALCKAFGTVTRESGKNGGAVKYRFKAEGRAMLKWFNARAG